MQGILHMAGRAYSFEGDMPTSMLRMVPLLGL